MFIGERARGNPGILEKQRQPEEILICVSFLSFGGKEPEKRKMRRAAGNLHLS